MKLLIVTGLSGAGKSLAIHALEDIGFFCIDNIPAGLLSQSLQFLTQSKTMLERVAIVLDVRGCRTTEDIADVLNSIHNSKLPYEILFLEAASDTIRRRYKETRRMHPLCSDENLTITEALEKEKELLRPLYEQANYIIDSSLLTTAQSKERICSLFLDSRTQPMIINVLSFGFKFGLPKEADLVFDVRCLPNPFYVPDLKSKTGLDSEVVDFVMVHEEAKGLLKQMISLLDYTVPLYVKEGKSQLTIALGCTGGKHRSITFARKIAEHFQQKNFEISVQHRDVARH